MATRRSERKRPMAGTPVTEHTAALRISETPTSIFRLLDLPDAIVAHLLANLDPQGICALSRVSRAIDLSAAAAARAERLAVPEELLEQWSTDGCARMLRSFWLWEKLQATDQQAPVPSV